VINRIVHTEFNSKDPKLTADCLEKLFGWKMTPMDMGGGEYILWNYPDDDKTGGGGIFKNTYDWTSPTTIEYIEVESIAQTIEKATVLGAGVMMPEQPIGANGEHGHYAVVNFPGDCPIGLWAKHAS
jgi:predicted enzyme related to lactoylglutathione lyase